MNIKSKKTGINVGKHISKYLNHFVSKDHTWKLELFQNWEKIIGKLKDKVIIHKIENNLLVLAVNHPVWANEIYLLKDLLKKKVNIYLEKEKIKKIQIKTIYSYKQNQKKEKFSFFYKDKNKNPTKITLNDAETENLSKINNKELKFWLKKFYVTCKRGRVKK
ncbi:DUF721 domain-containing protein [Candidatus Dependentiae bacterium]|nr:DUF721 domain-containing protein [Candidatus Dependentiae bacterium]